MVITILFIVGLLFSLSNKPVSGILAQERKFFLININQASAEELRLLPYVSDSMAEEIIRYRTEKGLFENIDELSEINGIGPIKLKRMKKYLRL